MLTISVLKRSSDPMRQRQDQLAVRRGLRLFPQPSAEYLVSQCGNIHAPTMLEVVMDSRRVPKPPQDAFESTAWPRRFIRFLRGIAEGKSMQSWHGQMRRPGFEGVAEVLV